MANVRKFATAFRETPVPCVVRQVDTSEAELQSGDIVLGRIGSSASVARPYLVVGK